VPLKVRPVPYVGIPFQPRLEHHITEIMPFSFDERDKEMFARKEEKMKSVLEEEKKVFISCRSLCVSRLAFCCHV